MTAGNYEIIVYGYSASTGGGTYNIGSDTVSTSGTGWVSGPMVQGQSYAVFNSVSTTGNLTINTVGIVNGMQLRYLGGDPVPEPFTMSLLGAAAFAGYRRIRKNRTA